MRLAFLVSFNLLIAACGGGSDSNQAPKQSRECGELDGVQPVEPVILGEDAVGCPVFAPVPCTEPVADYEAVCGSECGPRTATSPNGDSWLVGCGWRGGPDGCSGPDLELVLCSIDPFEGQELWLTFRDCQEDHFVYYWDCWMTCGGELEPSQIDCL